MGNRRSKKKSFLRKLQKSTQTYLVLSGVGAAALLAAPLAALYQLLQPTPTKAQRRRREHLKDQISNVAESAKESFGDIAASLESAFDPDADQEWLRKHRKLHGDQNDRDWEREHGVFDN